MSGPLANAPASQPATPEGRRAFTPGPFRRLARTHVANCMADAMLAAALADSIFFSMPADDARAPVIRYLLITMLPFAVVAPLVGPMIDRLKGGHRFVLIGSTAVRIVLCFLMMDEIERGGATFFLLALCVLVCQRAYNVARSAIVPSLVSSDDELIEANSKLAIIGGISAFVGIVPAGLLLKLGGPEWALGLAMITYGASSLLGLRIPASRVAVAKPDRMEKEELRGAGIRLAGGAMTLLRACVGFLTLLIAFDFRGGDRHPWEFGVVAGVSVLAQLLGAFVAPKLKAVTSEENILTGSLVVVAVGTFFALFVGEVLGACIVGTCVGLAAGSGKLAFDSILQRDAPDANRGRAFARYETRFQLAYVLGSFIPVAVHTGARAGFFVLLLIAVTATASYVIGRMAWAHRTGVRQTPATAAAVVVEERFAEVSGEVKDRIASAPRSVLSRFRGQPGDPEAPTVAVSEPPTRADPSLAPGPASVVDPTVPVAPFDQDDATVPLGGAPGPAPVDPMAVDDGDLDTTDPVWGDDPPPPVAPRRSSARPRTPAGQRALFDDGADDPTEPWGSDQP